MKEVREVLKYIKEKLDKRDYVNLLDFILKEIFKRIAMDVAESKGITPNQALFDEEFHKKIREVFENVFINSIYAYGKPAENEIKIAELWSSGIALFYNVKYKTFRLMIENEYDHPTNYYF